MVLEGSQIPVAIQKVDGSFWFVSKRPEFMRDSLEPHAYRTEPDRWLAALHAAGCVPKLCSVDPRLVHIRFQDQKTRSASQLARRVARESRLARG